jgi:hypothetical protein
MAGNAHTFRAFWCIFPGRFLSTCASSQKRSMAWWDHTHHCSPKIITDDFFFSCGILLKVHTLHHEWRHCSIHFQMRQITAELHAELELKLIGHTPARFSRPVLSSLRALASNQLRLTLLSTYIYYSNSPGTLFCRSNQNEIRPVSTQSWTTYESRYRLIL